MIRKLENRSYAGGLVAFHGGNEGKISNSYWYGEAITCAESGTPEANTPGGICGSSNSQLTVANCYYGLKKQEAGMSSVLSYNNIPNPADPSEITLTDPYDGNGATLKEASAFTGGEVAYLLDGGDGAHRNVWTQDTTNGYPIFGTPSYYKAAVTVSGGGGSATINQAIIAYAPPGTQLTVIINEETVTIDGKEYQYKFDRLEVDGSASPTSFTMPPAGNAAVTAFFTKTEVPVVEPPSDPPRGGDGSHNNPGDGTGDGSSAGQGGGSDTTASGQSGAPSTDGKELTDPLVIARQADPRLNKIRRNRRMTKAVRRQAGPRVKVRKKTMKTNS